jgi:hypothetical protein
MRLCQIREYDGFFRIWQPGSKRSAYLGSGKTKAPDGNDLPSHAYLLRADIDGLATHNPCVFLGGLTGRHLTASIDERIT